MERYDQSKNVFALGAIGEFGDDVKQRRMGGELPDPLWRTLFGEARPENVILEQLAPMVSGRTGPRTPSEHNPRTFSRWVKEAALMFGAAMVGIARLNPDHVYSHRGMKDDVRTGRFGEPIEVSHPTAISLAVPMDYRRLQASPSYLTDAEVAMGYVRVGIAAVMLAAYIRELGYDARAHYLRREEVLHVPIAIDAGLGELGRIGFLMTARYGPRIRLATVTTDLPLIPDQPARLGVHEFCLICELCADECPSRSIPRGAPTKEDGVQRWLMDPVSCYRWWNASPDRWGSCANCITACPWNKPDTWYHRMAAWAVSCTALFNRPLLWAERLLYGRRWQKMRGYRWLHYEVGKNIFPPGQKPK